MTLIPYWTAPIELPEYQEPITKIGKHSIKRVIIQKCIVEVSLFDSEIDGFYILKTSFDDYFGGVYIKKKGFKTKLPANKFQLKESEGFDIRNNIPKKGKLKWEHIPERHLQRLTSEEIRNSWENKFRFLKLNEGNGNKGLRSPQLGAIHATAAYFSTGNKHEPATIVLPTGTGKTETMLSITSYLGLSKVLVIVPSDILRKQLAEKFMNFGILPLIGVLPFGINRPLVTILNNGINNEDEAKVIVENSNIVVTIPAMINNIPEQIKKVFLEGFTDLIIDEAHHAPASTWKDVIEAFINKRIIQFTATPFRNDEVEIEGKIIYNYKLGNAQNDAFYKSIRFYPIENYKEQPDCDLEIALKTKEILTNDIEKDKYDHIVMVRANSKKRAEDLAELYLNVASEYNPVVIHSDTSKTEKEEKFRLLQLRESRILICVNMFGEGFDFPNLKITAIHDYHKSLAITLQFIGRITRQAENVGDAAVILNIADSEVDKGISKLYSADASWDDIIRHLSEERIEREIRLQDLIESLKMKGNLAEQISLRSLSPNFTTQIYKTKTSNWLPEKYTEAISQSVETFHNISEKAKLLIVLGVVESDVMWGKSQEINDIIHKLLIVYWDMENSCAFAYCNDYDGLRVSKIMQLIFDNNIELISGEQIFNILNKVELPLVKNLGSSKQGVISFTQYFGPNVTDGLSEIEKHTSELSNIACIGFEDGEKVLWGAAKRKGKVWARNGGAIDEWMEWCRKVWLKVDDSTADDNITKNFLRPILLESNYSIPPISIDWGEKIHIFGVENTKIIFGTKEVDLFLVDIVIIGFNANKIEFKLDCENVFSSYSFEINKTLTNGYRYTLIEGEPVSFLLGRSDPVILEEYFIKDPISISYSDGAYSYNKYLIQPNLNTGVYSKEDIEVWNWDGIPLNQESMGKEMNVNTIQFKTFHNVEDDFDLIINDDGKGESADLLCFKQIDDRNFNMTLIHCKNAKNAKPGADIDDLYTICGQAQKSIKTKHKGMKVLVNNITRREALWKKTFNTRFLKGSQKDLAYFKRISRTSKLNFEIVIVQPGISKELISEDMLRLLGTTELFIKKTSQGELRVIGST